MRSRRYSDDCITFVRALPRSLALSASPRQDRRRSGRRRPGVRTGPAGGSTSPLHGVHQPAGSPRPCVMVDLRVLRWCSNVGGPDSNFRPLPARWPRPAGRPETARGVHGPDLLILRSMKQRRTGAPDRTDTPLRKVTILVRADYVDISSSIVDLWCPCGARPTRRPPRGCVAAGVWCVLPGPDLGTRWSLGLQTDAGGSCLTRRCKVVPGGDLACDVESQASSLDVGEPDFRRLL